MTLFFGKIKILLASNPELSYEMIWWLSFSIYVFIQIVIFDSFFPVILHIVNGLFYTQEAIYTNVSSMLTTCRRSILCYHSFPNQVNVN